MGSLYMIIVFNSHSISYLNRGKKLQIMLKPHYDSLTINTFIIQCFTVFKRITNLLDYLVIYLILISNILLDLPFISTLL